MKFIKNDCELVSLENVMKVELRESGTGAKSNPFNFWITIHYFNHNDYTTIQCGDEKEEQIKMFKKIAKILAE